MEIWKLSHTKEEINDEFENSNRYQSHPSQRRQSYFSFKPDSGFLNTVFTFER